MLEKAFTPPALVSPGDEGFVPGEPPAPGPGPIDEDELARIRLGTDGCPHCDYSQETDGGI